MAARRRHLPSLRERLLPGRRERRRVLLRPCACAPAASGAPLACARPAEVRVCAGGTGAAGLRGLVPSCGCSVVVFSSAPSPRATVARACVSSLLVPFTGYVLSVTEPPPPSTTRGTTGGVGGVGGVGLVVKAIPRTSLLVLSLH